FRMGRVFEATLRIFAEKLQTVWGRKPGFVNFGKGIGSIAQKGSGAKKPGPGRRAFFLPATHTELTYFTYCRIFK
ncbi:MAG: hypothetical protein KFF46_06140, partial [Desulfobacterales bacterium]|nr:hypothetical protein [Desulfobacterales bacterium]